MNAKELTVLMVEPAKHPSAFLMFGRPEVVQKRKKVGPCQSIDAKTAAITRLQVPPSRIIKDVTPWIPNKNGNPGDFLFLSRQVDPFATIYTHFGRPGRPLAAGAPPINEKGLGILI